MMANPQQNLADALGDLLANQDQHHAQGLDRLNSLVNDNREALTLQMQQHQRVVDNQNLIIDGLVTRLHNLRWLPLLLLRYGLFLLLI